MIGMNESSLTVFYKGHMISTQAKESVPKIQILKDKIRFEMKNTISELSLTNHLISYFPVEDKVSFVLQNVTF